MAQKIISSGRPPIIWSDVNTAFEEINQNFTELYLSIGGSGVDLENLPSNLIPDSNVVRDLGSPSRRWRHLYLSGNSLYLGSAEISIDEEGGILLPAGSKVGGNLIKDPEESSFKTFSVSGQSDIVADNFEGVVTFAGEGIDITTNAATDTITFTNDGVTSITAGDGISVDQSSGIVEISNDGILDILTGNGLSSVIVNGVATVSNSGVISLSGGNSISVVPGTTAGSFVVNNLAPYVPPSFFRTISVTGQATIQDDIQAISANDELTLSSTGISISTDPSSKTITFSLSPEFDLKGSVFADDSTKLVDAVEGKIVGPINSFDGANSISMDYTYGVVIGGTGGASVIGAAGAPVYIGSGPSGSTSGTVTIGHGGNQVTVNGTLAASLQGNSQGFHTGDVKGSVFGDDSTTLVDSVSSKIVGPIETSSLRTSDTEIALGSQAGETNQGLQSVAIGNGAGNLDQDIQSVAIGSLAGGLNQGQRAVAIGSLAGSINQGDYAVALGNFAGGTNQPANSIMINASGLALNGSDAGFYVDPIREVTGPQVLYYDPTGTKEITWGPVPAGGGGGSGDFDLSVAADDSTLRKINSGETIKFIGGTGITTSSDGEGAITISADVISGLASRTTTSGSTGSIADAATANVTITGFKGYLLYKIQTSAAAWVRIYTSIAARTADSSRAEGVDPSPGAGVIAEVITTGAETILITPGTIGFNDESPVDTNIQLAVTNKSGSPADITVTLTIVKVED